MLEPLHLYPKKKMWMEAMENQGYTQLTCNDWLCPFNNESYCVSPQGGDECTWDDDFKKHLDAVYDERLPDEVREAYRTIMIYKWGEEDQEKDNEM